MTNTFASLFSGGGLADIGAMQAVRGNDETK